MFYKFAHVVVGFLFRILYRFRVTGRDHVPPGGVLLCANHTANSDPVLVALALHTKDRPRFMAKAELFRVFGLRWLIRRLGAFPIERGQSDLTAIKTGIQLLRDGEKLLMFPQGHRMKSSDAMAVKAGAAMLASRTGVPILPIFISEGRKPLFSRIEVVIGKPFTPESGEGQSRAQRYEAISDRLAAEITALGQGKLPSKTA